MLFSIINQFSQKYFMSFEMHCFIFFTIISSVQNDILVKSDINIIFLCNLAVRNSK